jgi:hypothetical protein
MMPGPFCHHSSFLLVHTGSKPRLITHLLLKTIVLYLPFLPSVETMDAYVFCGEVQVDQFCPSKEKAATCISIYLCKEELLTYCCHLCQWTLSVSTLKKYFLQVLKQLMTYNHNHVI